MRVLRLAEVIEKTGLARSTIYKYADLGRFPRPISLVGASVGWLEAEVAFWLASCAGASSEESLNEFEAPSEAA
jgi:prophage regulatory protein